MFGGDNQKRVSTDQFGDGEGYEDDEEWQGKLIIDSLQSVELGYSEIKEKDNESFFTPNTNALWKIEADENQKGGKITKDGKYRLRHFSTGKYLGVGRVSHHHHHGHYTGTNQHINISNNNIVNHGTGIMTNHHKHTRLHLYLSEYDGKDTKDGKVLKEGKETLF